MPSNQIGLRLFVLAHPDDEIFFLPFFLNNDMKHIVFLTKGVNQKASMDASRRRLHEAKRAMNRTFSRHKVASSFIGSELNIPEGALHEHLSHNLFSSILEVAKLYGQIKVLIYTTTFEGGHQDHDSCAILARKLGKKLNAEVVEVSGYRQIIAELYAFTTMNPEDKLHTFHFPRLKSIKLALVAAREYRSQLRTWLGLLPFVILRYLKGQIWTCKPKEIGIQENCFYEFRGRGNQKEVISYLAKFNSSQL